MARYIDADELNERIDYAVKKGMGGSIGYMIKNMVGDTPTADVRENVKGEWIFEENGIFRCSFCGERYYLVDDAKLCDYNFCPDCGADMRGEKDDD